MKFLAIMALVDGALDHDEFWHAWARCQKMTLDPFDPGWDVWQWVEHHLKTRRRNWNVTPPGRPAT